MKWSTLGSSKVGGLGVRNLKLHNKSLLLKWFWMFNDGKEAIWKNVLDMKYGLEGNWAPKPLRTPYMVFLCGDKFVN